MGSSFVVAVVFALALIEGAVSWNHTCTFDVDSCGWLQSNNDDFDWLKRSGAISGGVNGDHTGNGSYMFLDDSGSSSADDTALLMSPVFVLSKPSAVNVTFWYHMSGAGVGNLSLLVFDRLPHYEAWRMCGDQGPGWRLAVVEINVLNKFQIGFSGNRIKRHAGGTAVDDVFLSTETPASVVTLKPPTKKTHSPLTASTPGPTGADCNFDTPDKCGYDGKYHNVGAEWVWTEGYLGGGNMEARANDTTPPGASIRLTSPLVIGTTGPQCLQWAYRFDGTKFKPITVYVVSYGYVFPSAPVWTCTTKGKLMMKAQTDINPFTNFQIVFEVAYAEGGPGVAEVDDVFIIPGVCPQSTTLRVSTTALPSTSLSCYFDTFCGFGQRPLAKWAIAKDSGSNYAVLKNATPNEKISLVTPFLAATNQSCLEFKHRNLDSVAFILKVFIIENGAKRKPILSPLSGSSTWKFERVEFLSPTNYQIQFEGARVSPEDGAVALGDVNVNVGHCTRPTTPLVQTTVAPLSALSCWFNTFCGFTQTPLLKWELTKDSEGSFALLQNATLNEKISLLTTPLVAMTHGCLEFSHRDVDSGSFILNVNIIEHGTKRKRLTSSLGGSGVWRFERIEFLSAAPYQIEFEGARLSPEAGAVAIDDVFVYGGACKPTRLQSANCRFGGDAPSFCKYTSSPSTWSVIKENPFPSTYPTYSHGWYASLKSEIQPKETKLGLLSTPLSGDNGTYCMGLDYFFKSYGVSELNVHLRDGQSDVIIWQRRNTVTNSSYNSSGWRYAETTIVAPGVVYQINLEAVTGTSQEGEVGIGNIVFKAGACTSYSCSFDNGLCSYKQNLYGSGNKDWHFSSDNANISEAVRDHTSGNGTFLYLPWDTLAMNNGGRALLYTPVVKANEFHCFVFWYFITQHTTISLTIFIQPEDSSPKKGLWFLEFDQYNGWQKGMVDFQSASDVRIVVEGDNSFAKNGFAAVDDVRLTVGACNQKPLCRSGPCMNSGTCIDVPDNGRGAFYICQCPIEYTGTHCETLIVGKSTATASSTATTPPHVATVLDCDFDISLCGYVRDPSRRFTFRWLSTEEGRTRTDGTGPKMDHTSGKGEYVYVEAGNGFSGADAFLISPVMEPVTQRCLQFWFHMYGVHIGTLNVQTLIGGTKSTIWSLSGEQANEWRRGQIDINVSVKFQIVFEGIKTSSWRQDKGDISLDDVVLLMGRCSDTTTTVSTLPPTTATTPSTPSTTVVTKPTTLPIPTSPTIPGECTFDAKKDFCGYEQDVSDDFDWIQNQGPTTTYLTGPENDHTSSKGFYVYIESSSPRKKGERARLTSPSIPGGVYNCFTFWYSMYGAGMGSLRAYVDINGQKIQVWSKEGDQGKNWTRGYVDTSMYTDNFKVIFEGIVGSEYTSDIAIDDLMPLNMSCFSNGSDTTTPKTGSDVTTDIMSTSVGNDFTTKMVPLTTEVTTRTTSSRTSTMKQSEITIVSTKHSEPSTHETSIIEQTTITAETLSPSSQSTPKLNTPHSRPTSASTVSKLTLQSTPGTDGQGTKTGQLNLPALIAGPIVGALLLVVVGFVLILVIRRRRKRQMTMSYFEENDYGERSIIPKYNGQSKFDFNNPMYE